LYFFLQFGFISVGLKLAIKTHPDNASLVGPLFAAQKEGKSIIHNITPLFPPKAKRGSSSEAMGG